LATGGVDLRNRIVRTGTMASYFAAYGEARAAFTRDERLGSVRLVGAHVVFLQGSEHGWCADQEREALPVPSDGEGAMGKK
jgi:hypothetical protein